MWYKKPYLKILFVFLVFFLVVDSTNSYAQNASVYRLASGDVISISVFGEPELSIQELRLTDAGSFSYPFFGEIQAKGKTAAEVEKLIADELKNGYLVDPRVTVSVREYREFFISGEVNNPGGFPFQPGLTVRSASALAGGLTERASEKRITIIHDTDATRKPQSVSMDDPVMPGDTIIIEQGFF